MIIDNETKLQVEKEPSLVSTIFRRLNNLNIFSGKMILDITKEFGYDNIWRYNDDKNIEVIKQYIIIHNNQC